MDTLRFDFNAASIAGVDTEELGLDVRKILLLYEFLIYFSIKSPPPRSGTYWSLTIILYNIKLLVMVVIVIIVENII